MWETGILYVPLQYNEVFTNSYWSHIFAKWKESECMTIWIVAYCSIFVDGCSLNL